MKCPDCVEINGVETILCRKHWAEIEEFWRKHAEHFFEKAIIVEDDL